jgi:aminopeptidase 2
MNSGLSLDALRSSHPIQVDVNKPSDILQIFDAISYLKGASLIRMLNSFLGPETFAKGVQTYLKEFSFKNAETKDLWKHLGAAAGKDVEALMSNWTGRMGYPSVKVMAEEYDEVKKEMTLTVKQTRFLSSGDWSEEEDKDATVWWIPLGIVTDTHTEPFDLMLSEKEGKVTFPYVKTDKSYYKLNFKSRAFYRMNLSVEDTQKWSKLIANGDAQLSMTDRIGLLSDSLYVSFT